MALNAGSIYAEAELNVERFLSAAGELEGASERIAAAMAGSAASAESAAQGILGYGDAVGMAASQAGAEGARLAQS